MHLNITLIMSILLIGIVVICAWQGFKKGIIMGIVEILVILLSVFGAQLLAEAYAYEVIPALKPFVAGYMETRVEAQAYTLLGYEPDEEGNYNVTYSLHDLLEANPEIVHSVYQQSYRGLGIADAAAEKMAVKADNYREENNSSVVDAAVYVFCQTATWVLAFALAFLLLFVVLTVIVNLPNLSLRIPFVGLINDLGGLGLGIVTGYLFCSLILWFCQYLGIVLPQDALRSSNAAAYFMDMNLISQFISF